MSEKVIAVKRNKVWMGRLDGLDFTPTEKLTISTMAKAIKDRYILLHDFLLLTEPKITRKESERRRKEIGYSKIYVYVEDNEDFWAYTNHKCNTCMKDCKQSSKVELLACPQYEEIKE